MIETKSVTKKPKVRCAECDREVSHYITFTSPTNEKRDICSDCLEREEKHFNLKPTWKRQHKNW
jgi:hypothetical protein